MLGAGGLLQRHKKSSRLITVCGTEEWDNPRLYRATQATGSALKKLGVISRYKNLLFPDQSLTGANVAVIAERVLGYIEDDTSIVVTHESDDLNADHRIVSEAVSVALRGRRNIKLLHAEVPGSHDPTKPAFSPNSYLPLTKQALERKIKAMECYAGESRKWPHPRSSEALRLLASMRGIESGCEFSEAFRLVREVL